MIRCDFVLAMATINDFEWQSDDKALQGALNAMLSDEWLSPSVPDSDYKAALDATEKLGGRIVGEYIPPEQVDGRIY